MEDYDGVDDLDGCPEAEDTPRDLVVTTESDIKPLEPIEFEFDKDVLRDSAYPILDAVYESIRDNDLKLVEVQGHTDEQGGLAYNDDLSERRAATVKRYLVEKGIPASRLLSKGYGERKPVDEAHTQAAYEKNRRVAFVIKQR
jgi:outer membrane protein OmpA-like peptidoglycan-associated protein